MLVKNLPHAGCAFSRCRLCLLTVPLRRLDRDRRPRAASADAAALRDALDALFPADPREPVRLQVTLTHVVGVYQGRNDVQAVCFRLLPLTPPPPAPHCS